MGNIESLIKLGELGPVALVAICCLLLIIVVGWFLIRTVPSMQVQGIHAVNTAVAEMRKSVAQTRDSIEEQKKLRETMAESQVREHARAEQRHAEVMTALERQHAATMAAIGGLRTDFLPEALEAPSNERNDG